MAFDVPLEADQPGQSGFLTSIIKAPLVWILGSDIDENEIEDETNKLQALKLNQKIPEHDQMRDFYQPLAGRKRRAKRSNAKYKSDSTSTNVPDIAESDMSSSNGDDVDYSYSADEWDRVIQPDVVPTNRDERLSLNDLRRLRRTSWSDESGQSLVKYLDETSLHEPQTDAQPIKSAMKRTKTAYSNVVAVNSRDAVDSSNIVNSATANQQQYIPSGITGGNDKLILPNGGELRSGNGNNSNGYISPQWGWYISTTPPTDEKYADKKNNSCVPKPAEISASEKKFNTKYVPISEQTYCHDMTPMPVFTKGVKGQGKAHMGWSGIPL